jgi:hypothetical protein
MYIEDTLFSLWNWNWNWVFHFLDKLGFFIIIADGPFQEAVKSLGAKEALCNISRADSTL